MNVQTIFQYVFKLRNTNIQNCDWKILVIRTYNFILIEFFYTVWETDLQISCSIFQKDAKNLLPQKDKRHCKMLEALPPLKERWDIKYLIWCHVEWHGSVLHLVHPPSGEDTVFFCYIELMKFIRLRLSVNSICKTFSFSDLYWTFKKYPDQYFLY